MMTKSALIKRSMRMIDDMAELREMNAELLAALQMARDYMNFSLGSPGWDGENPFPVIDAALERARAGLTEQVS